MRVRFSSSSVRTSGASLAGVDRNGRGRQRNGSLTMRGSSVCVAQTDLPDFL